MIEVQTFAESIGDISEELGVKIDVEERRNGLFAGTVVSVTIPYGKGQLKLFAPISTVKLSGTPPPDVDSLGGRFHE